MPLASGTGWLPDIGDLWVASLSPVWLCSSARVFVTDGLCSVPSVDCLVWFPFMAGQALRWSTLGVLEERQGAQRGWSRGREVESGTGCKARGGRGASPRVGSEWQFIFRVGPCFSDLHPPPPSNWPLFCGVSRDVLLLDLNRLESSELIQHLRVLCIYSFCKNVPSSEIQTLK